MGERQVEVKVEREAKEKRGGGIMIRRSPENREEFTRKERGYPLAPHPRIPIFRYLTEQWICPKIEIEGENVCSLEGNAASGR
ncbi:MAG: hypothetical protein K8I29_13755 [Alphaproteobacteria bacterium]|uniref:Uncharacterized protein n=1 Tax=Candidatus Nitrobium versatile TaxID=2884831 RepID=A0A953M263_9BACT|nr:hypothetical protein [Candidatus Nitrobium versatile]